MNRCPMNDYPLAVAQALGKCDTCEYSKGWICDHPYKRGMSYEECREMTEQMKEERYELAAHTN